MKKITVELMQHTPMIHFQVRYDQNVKLREQCGATLRASEVKPKLDRFLLNKLGKDELKGCLVGSGTHDALDYKMKIVADDGDGTASVVQLPQPTSTYNNNKKKWRADFPMLLANLMGGGQENIEDLRFLSMHKKVTMSIYLRAREVKDGRTGEIHLDDKWYEKLEKKLREFLPEFFATTNFGQRSNKGFGSFTVNSIDDGEPLYGKDYADKSLFMDYCLGKNLDVYSLEVQKKLFTVIDFFWIELTHHIYKDEKVDLYNVTDTKSYIKVMAKYNLNQDRKNHDDKLRLNADVKRLPAPILFKPISFLDEDGKLWFSVFIMMDCNMFQSLCKNLGKSTKKVTNDKNIILHIGSKEDWNINDINDFVDKDFANWKRERSFDIIPNKQNRSKGRAIGSYKVVFF